MTTAARNEGYQCVEILPVLQDIPFFALSVRGKKVVFEGGTPVFDRKSSFEPAEGGLSQEVTTRNARIGLKPVDVSGKAYVLVSCALKDGVSFLPEITWAVPVSSAATDNLDPLVKVVNNPALLERLVVPVRILTGDGSPLSVDSDRLMLASLAANNDRFESFPNAQQRLTHTLTTIVRVINTIGQGAVTEPQPKTPLGRLVGRLRALAA